VSKIGIQGIEPKKKDDLTVFMDKRAMEQNLWAGDSRKFQVPNSKKKLLRAPEGPWRLQAAADIPKG